MSKSDMSTNKKTTNSEAMRGNAGTGPKKHNNPGPSKKMFYGSDKASSMFKKYQGKEGSQVSTSNTRSAIVKGNTSI